MKTPSKTFKNTQTLASQHPTTHLLYQQMQWFHLHRTVVAGGHCIMLGQPEVVHRPQTALQLLAESWRKRPGHWRMEAIGRPENLGEDGLMFGVSMGVNLGIIHIM